jgi:hypothetical protein
MPAQKNTIERIEQSITYVTVVAIIETAAKSLDYFIPLFLASADIPAGFLLGTPLGVGIRIACIWYLYTKKSRIAASILLALRIVLLVIGASTNIFSSLFLIFAALGVYETFRYHSTVVSKPSEKIAVASSFRSYVSHPMTWVWVAYVIVSGLSVLAYLGVLLAQPPRPNFSDADIKSVQQSLLQMRSGEWDMQEAVDNLSPETKQKIRQMGMTEEEFLQKIILGLLSNSLGVDINGTR